MTFFIEKNTISAVFQNSISGYNTCFARWFGIEYVISELNMDGVVMVKTLKGVGFFDKQTGMMVSWSEQLNAPKRGTHGSLFYWLTEDQVRMLSFDQAKSIEMTFEQQFLEEYWRDKNESNN
jgi:hypothetical protein